VEKSQCSHDAPSAYHRPAVGPSPRPSVSRTASTLSAASHNSESSFGTISRLQGGRPPLRSQSAQQDCESTYDSGDSRSVTASPQLPSSTLPVRSRSASQPCAYVPQKCTAKYASAFATQSLGPAQAILGRDEAFERVQQLDGWTTRIIRRIVRRRSRRCSANPQLGGMAGRFAVRPWATWGEGEVHFGNDIFVIQVSRAMESRSYWIGREEDPALGPRRDDGSLRIKYEDGRAI